LPPVSFGAGIGIESVAEAQKHAKFAVSALGFEDVPTAIDNLQKALFLLEGRLEPR
jgi:vacuolar protein sorting-associated protein VTA1|tara:strand:+ start:180 stop:347 length:168 start_codon:yes stop_codon:yes gene_type:complete